MLSARFACHLRLAAIACAVTLSGATGSLGCKKSLSVKTEEAGAPARSSQDEADEQMQDKLEPYTECLNTLSAAVHATRARYFAWVDPKKGVTGNERVVLGVLDLPKDAAPKCAAGLATAKGLPPKDAKLEAAGDEFAKSVTELDGLIDEAFAYYEQKTFKTDKLAKGKQMHPKLAAAFSAFSKADADLHKTLGAFSKPLAQRTLDRLEREDGRKFRFHRKRVLLTARDLVDAGDPVGEDDDLDASLFKASFEEFEKAAKEQQAFGLLHKNELDAQSNPAWPLAKSNFDQFDRAAETYRKKARDYNACLQEAPPKSKAPSGKIDPEKLPPCANGATRREVVTAFNELIRVANAHQFP